MPDLSPETLDLLERFLKVATGLAGATMNAILDRISALDERQASRTDAALARQEETIFKAFDLCHRQRRKDSERR